MQLPDGIKPAIIPREANAGAVWGNSAIGQPTINYYLIIKKY